MSKTLVIPAADYRSLRDLPIGGSLEAKVKNGTRVPGAYDVTCGGGARSISCQATEPSGTKSGPRSKKKLVRLTRT